MLWLWKRQRFSLLSGLSITAVITATLFHSSHALITIQVCQNKDCCRRFQGEASLVETLEDLVIHNVFSSSSAEAAVLVQTTGCLSQCDQGPNVCISNNSNNNNNNGRVIHGLETPLHVVALLEEKTNSEDPDTAEPSPNPSQGMIHFPPKVINAITVLEKGQKAPSLPEKERFFTSVMNALDKDASLCHSMARIHAQTLRAQARLNAQHYETALQDVSELLETYKEWIASIFQSATNNPAQQWYRIAADAYEGLQRYPEAAQAWQQVAQCDRKFQTKAAKEIRRLQQLSSSST